MKHLYLYAILGLLFGCKKIDTLNSDSISVNQTSIDSSDQLRSVFLGLNPRMNSDAFEERINKLNQEGKLIDSTFVFETNGEEYTFNLSKDSSSIILKYDNIISKANTNLNHSKSLELLNEYEIEKNFLMNFFKKKYVQIFDDEIDAQIIFPKFKMLNYLVFEDSTRYIFVGYTILGNDVLSATELKNNYNKNPDDPLASLENFITQEIVQKIHTHNLGLNLKLDIL